MDGIPTASFPAPVPTAPTAPPGVSFVPPAAAPPVRTAAPVGRPNSDPEVQQQREERAGTRKRLAAALPREMTEPRIVVYRLKGRSGQVKMNNRPVLTILVSDLEEATAQGAEAGDYIRSKITEKFPESQGRFLWEAQSHTGQKMTEYGSYEINMSDDDDLDDLEDDDQEEMLMRPDGKQYGPWDAPRPSGPPPADPSHHLKQMRMAVEDTYKRQESSSSTMLQMMMHMAETRRQEEESRRRDEEARRREEESRRREDENKKFEMMKLEIERKEKEAERREAREREERRLEADRQMQFMKMMMDSSKKDDTLTPMLFKMLDSKGDRDGTKELFGMFNEASKQSMLMQGEASKHMMAAQADASKMLISNILGISKQMVEAQLEAGQSDPDEDPMDKIGRMFKIFGPAIQAIGGGAQTQQQMVQSQQRLPPPPQMTQAQQPQQQRGPFTRKGRPDIPDNQWIKGSLDTIMQLENGQIAAEQRLPALKWCAENLPEKMLAPIRAGDEMQVLAVGAEAADETFQSWLFADEKHTEFLRDCVADIQRMLVGAFTEAAARESMQKHAAYHQAKHGQPFPQEETAPEQPKAQEPEPEKKSGKRAPPPIATPVEETKPTAAPQVQNAAPGNI